MEHHENSAYSRIGGMQSAGHSYTLPDESHQQTSNSHEQMNSSSSSENVYYQPSAIVHSNNHFTVPRIGPLPNQIENVPKDRKVLLDQERFLPIANVGRIMKSQIPAIGKIAKDAKELVQECVSEFISFIASEACDRCMKQKRKTISADDLIDAIELLGFDGYVEPLRFFLHRYRTAHRLNPVTDASSNPSEVNRLGSYLGNDEDDDENFNDQDSERGSPPVLQRLDGASTSLEHNTTMQHESYMNSHHRQNQYSATPEANIEDYASETGYISNELQMPSQSDVQPTPIAVMAGCNGDARTLHPEQMQLYIDPETKQHYMVVDAGNGQQGLYPVVIQGVGGPLPVVSMNGVGMANIQEQDVVLNTEDESIDYKSMYVTSEYTEDHPSNSEVKPQTAGPSKVQSKRTSSRTHPYSRSNNLP